MMKAIEVITNLHTDDIERAREFFGFLGLTEDTMNQGWVARRFRHDNQAVSEGNDQRDRFGPNSSDDRARRFCVSWER
jgi:hypothetical protein